MKDLNRYVVKKYATDWKDVGLELEIEINDLKIIEKDHPQDCVACFQETLNKWLKLTPNATWRSLEVALDNVKKYPADNMYGKDIMCMLILYTLSMKHWSMF